MWLLLCLNFDQVRKGRVWPGGLYIESALDAARHVAEPNDAYLFGRVRRGGWWYYFPVVATCKVPLGIAAIMLLGAISLRRRRPTFDEWSLALPAIAYTIALMAQSINIGWRHFLPAYVFMMLLATRCVAAPHPSRRRHLVLALAALSLLATILDTARYYPDVIAYLNWPRANAHLAITDSNVDWGQGLKQAHAWLAANESLVRGRTVHLRAFGVSNRAIRHYLQGRVHTLHAGDRPPDSGLLILSPVCLTGISESHDEYAFLRGIEPDAIIGHTLRVYDLDRLLTSSTRPRHPR
jgi:hypothetical protein